MGMATGGMKAGFAHGEITPPVGTHKIGWIKDIVSESVLDPLFVRAVVFDDGRQRVALVQLDTLSVRWTTVREIREGVQQRCGIPARNVLVAATHNHGGPAVATVGDAKRDETYVAFMREQAIEACGRAAAALCPAEIGFGRTREFGLTHNRRMVLRSGTAITHADGSRHPEALYVEGPIDPEVGVIGARGRDGALLGAVVNFTCHPTHHGGGTALTAGYPGVLARELAVRGCPQCVFLNGATGNVSPGNPYVGIELTMEEIGVRLAEDASKVLQNTAWTDAGLLDARSVTLQLAYRRYTAADVRGSSRGAQRFVDPSAYDRAMPALLERIRARGCQPAEVQAVRVGSAIVVGVPAEYFVQFGLRIKEEGHPANVLVAGHANGMIGYVPTEEAFRRGGYETTFGPGWRMAPETGALIAGAAVRVVRELGGPHAPCRRAE